MKNKNAKTSRGRGRPPVYQWSKITPQMWRGCTFKEIAVRVGCTEMAARNHYKKLVAEGRDLERTLPRYARSRKERLEDYAAKPPLLTKEGELARA